MTQTHSYTHTNTHTQRKGYLPRLVVEVGIKVRGTCCQLNKTIKIMSFRRPKY